MATSFVPAAIHRRVRIVLTLSITAFCFSLTIQQNRQATQTYLMTLEHRWTDWTNNLRTAIPLRNDAGAMLPATHAPSDAWIDLFMISFLGLTLSLGFPRQSTGRSFIYGGVLLVFFGGLSIWAFLDFSLAVAFVYPALALVAAGATFLAIQHLTIERSNRRTRQILTPHLDPLIIEHVIRQRTRFKLDGERRDMSVLFADIRSFTSLSERMSSTEVVSLLNQFFDRMIDIIFQYRGTLDKLIGDAVMGFWGHPVDNGDHALRATVCALEMAQAADDLRSVLVLPGGARFEIGIGVNSGPMVVGNMGTRHRFNYTVMGDQVKLASRLEPLNRYSGTRVLITSSTYEACKQVVLCRELDTIQVKGTSQVVTIYEPLGLRHLDFDRRETERRGPVTRWKRIKRLLVTAWYGERRLHERRIGSARIAVRPEQEEIATMYEHALGLYRAGDLDDADIAFDHVLKLNPYDGPSILLKDRIARYRTELAPEGVTFDPVYKLDDR